MSETRRKGCSLCCKVFLLYLQLLAFLVLVVVRLEQGLGGSMSWWIIFLPAWCFVVISFMQGVAEKHLYFCGGVSLAAIWLVLLNLYLSAKLISRLYFAFVPLWLLLLCLLHNVTRDIVKPYPTMLPHLDHHFLSPG